jgi:hypothetical protein
VTINTSELKTYLLSSDKEGMGAKVRVTGLTDVAEETSQLMSQKVCNCHI